VKILARSEFTSFRLVLNGFGAYLSIGTNIGLLAACWIFSLLEPHWGTIRILIFANDAGGTWLLVKSAQLRPEVPRNCAMLVSNRVLITLIAVNVFLAFAALRFFENDQLSPMSSLAAARILLQTFIFSTMHEPVD
jgi:hypothetical protein